MKSALFICFFLFQLFTLHAQVVKAQILDEGSKEPIPFANVVFGKNQGVISNGEGVFSFTVKDTLPVQIRISSMGYETLQLRSDEIIGGEIGLTAAPIELREVYVSNRHLSPEEIVEKAKDAVAENYPSDLSQKKIFFRESSLSQIRKFKMRVEESTIPGIDQGLLDRIVAEMPKESDAYKEVLAVLSGDYDSQHVQILKAADLYNPQNTQSLDQLTEHLEILFRKNLKEKSFLKIKSGLFGVKVDAAELEAEFAEDDPEGKSKTSRDLAEESAKARLRLQKQTDENIRDLYKNLFWKEDITFNLFDKTRKYKFDLQGYMTLGEASVYVIEFKPRRNADFRGKIFIDVLDYGVHRIQYENVKPISKFRLFGISTSEEIYRGKMIFVKDTEGKYSLRYLEREEGSTAGIDRPLKIIEKNRHVPGRNKQNELDLDLNMQFAELEKLQLVVYGNEALNRREFEAILPVEENFEYRKFKTYNPHFWRGHNIIEPNTAIKQFTALEEE